MNVNDFLISFAMSVYNGEKTIVNTLKSLQNQTWENFECIIVDDNSTDETVNIIYNQFCKKDKRFKLITNMCADQEKLAYASNLSYELCNGKYLFRVDADNIYFNDYAEYCVRFLEEHPEYDGVSPMSERMFYNDLGSLEKLPNEDDKIWRNGNKQEQVELFNTSNIWCIHGNTVVWSNSTSCLRKSFYEKFKPKWYFYEFGDIFFWMDVLAYGGKLYKTQDIKNYDVVRKTSTSRSKEFYLWHYESYRKFCEQSVIQFSDILHNEEIADMWRERIRKIDDRTINGSEFTWNVF